MKMIKNYSFSIVVSILLLVLALAYFVYVSRLYSSSGVDAVANMNLYGVFGDFFNGVSAPFLGFVGICLTLVTIYAQSKNQLELSQHALIQSKLQQESTFVSVYNSMMDSYRQSQNELTLKKGNKTYNGRKVFEVLNSELKHFYGRDIQDNEKLGQLKVSKSEVVKKSMEVMHTDRLECYERHFKILYNTLKYIDMKCVSDDDKNLYSGMLRSFISLDEEKFLFYEALQFDKFKELLEKYSMMHDVKNDLLDPEHVDLYNPSAFT